MPISNESDGLSGDVVVNVVALAPEQTGPIDAVCRA